MTEVAFLAPAASAEQHVRANAYLAAAGSAPATSAKTPRSLVIVETPYASPSESGRALNQLYARAALRDSLLRGESPMASHMLYAQTFVLDDTDPDEHDLAVAAGQSWFPFVQTVVVYIDRGISEGMREGISRARELGVAVEERSITEWARG